MNLSFVASLASALSACSVSMPFRWPGYDPAKGITAPGAGKEVLVVITHPKVHRQKRAAFDDYTQRLLKSMHNSPGLIGYSARRQILGDEAWTVSVWVDEAAMKRFVRSPEHEAAMDAGVAAIDKVRFRRQWLPAGELPLNWERTLAILNDGSTPPESSYRSY